MNSGKAVCCVSILFFAGLGSSAFCMAAETGQALNLPPGNGAGKVLGIHRYTLRAGVEPEGFEKFMALEYLPALKDIYAGVEFFLMKGDRGKNIGQYIFVAEMSSLSVRNRYWPKPDEQSEAAKSAVAKCGARCTELIDRLMRMVERTEFTDYAALTKK